jgi:hypothetical protein
MVNLEKRQIGRRLIERFLAGEITNDEFNDMFPRDDADPALDAIYSNLWCYYSETHSHKLGGKYSLRPDAKDLFRRCAAFLGSDLEYEWPDYRWVSPKYALFRLFGLSKRVNEQFERFTRHGSFEVWPFLREGDYRQVAADR